MDILDANSRYLQMGSANMQDNIRDPKLTMSDGLYRFDHPDSDIFLPRPVRTASVRTLGDYIRHLQEVPEQPDESNKSSESNQPDFTSDADTIVYTAATCVCTTGNEQSDCESCDQPIDDGFADNIQYAHLDPTGTSEGNEPEVRGWPCVVIGAEGRRNSAEDESVSGSQHQSGDTP